jgi:hypothetical protein
MNIQCNDLSSNANDQTGEGLASKCLPSDPGQALGQHVDVRALRIRTLNDAFRQSFIGGRVMLTQGVMGLGKIVQAEVLAKVQSFCAFNDGNDPYREYDFGCIEHGGETVFFKIDYYDLKLEHGSPDPANPKVTTRVLTIMLAHEW